MWTNPPRVLALEIARIKDKNPFELITAAMVHDIGMPMGDAKRHGRFIEYDLDVGTSFDQIRHLDFDRLIFNSDATKKRKIRV